MNRKLLLHCGDVTEADYWPFACECTTVDVEAHYSSNTMTWHDNHSPWFSVLNSEHENDIIQPSALSDRFHHEYDQEQCPSVHTEKSLLAFTAHKNSRQPTTFGCELVPKSLSQTNKETDQSPEKKIFSQLSQSSFAVTCSIVKQVEEP